mgnify:CR=1 FL=1
MTTYEEIKKCKLTICPKCKEILEKNNGKIPITGESKITNFKPKMWKHSERDVYHAWILIEGRHVFLCGTDEFDELTLKRIRPLEMEDSNIWNISINGKSLKIIEYENERYEILYEDGTIVKDEEIEAKVFNHMMQILNKI